MPLDDYRNVFLAAGVASYQRDSFARCLDALVLREHLDATDLLGVSGGPSNDLYVVHRDAVYRTSESGMFTKRQTFERLGEVASIANLRGAQETVEAFEFLLIAEDASGNLIFKLSWPLQLGDDAGTERAAGQRKHLFEVMSAAMDRAGAVRGAPTTPPRCPCGAGNVTMEHMREHVVDLLATDGVEALTYRCPICGFVEGELWSRTEEGQGGVSAGLYVHLLQVHNSR